MIVKHVNEKLAKKILSTKSMNLTLGNIEDSTFGLRKFKTWEGLFSSLYIKPNTDGNLTVKVSIKETDLDIIFTDKSAFIYVNGKVYNALTYASDIFMIPMVEVDNILKMHAPKIAEIIKRNIPEIDAVLATNIFCVICAGVIGCTIYTSNPTIKVESNRDHREEILSEDDNIIVDFKNEIFSESNDEIKKYYKFSDNIFRTKNFPFKSATLLTTVFDSIADKGMSSPCKCKISVSDPDSIEQMRNMLLDRYEPIELVNAYLNKIEEIGDLVDQIDDLLSKIRNDIGSYMTVSILCGCNSYIQFILDDRMNVCKFSNGEPIAFVKNERRDLFFPDDVALQMNETIKRSKVGNLKNISNKIMKNCVDSKNTIFEHIERIETFIKSLYIYIKSSAEGLKDIDIRVVEKGMIGGHRKYSNPHSRKGCIVKGHFRHYKSGLITFVHPYTRKGTNFEGRIVIEI